MTIYNVNLIKIKIFILMIDQYTFVLLSLIDIRHAVRLNVIFSCHDGCDNDDLETF